MGGSDMPAALQARGPVRCRWPLLVCVAALVPVASAQHQSYNLPPQLPAAEVTVREQERRALFARIQADPADIEAGFAYAVLSTALGDLEAAVATYERLLIQHPGTPRLQLELAALYFRLGAVSASRSLFQTVAAGELPANVRLRVEGYLSALDGQQRQQGGFSGRLSLGLRHESNANAAPDVGTINLNGLDFTLAPQARRAGDSSSQLGLQLRYRQPLGGSGHRMEVAVAAADGRYRGLENRDNQMLEVRAGPDLSLAASGLRDGRAWLAVVGAQSWLDGSRYQHSEGLNLGLRWGVARQAALQLSADWRQERYTPGAELAAAANYSGHRRRVGLQFQQQLADDWQWLAGLAWEQRSAQVAWEDYREPRLQVGISHRYPGLLGQGSVPWTLSLSAQQAWREHAAPMPVVNRQQVQDNAEQQLQLVNLVPLGRDTELQLYLGWRRIDSNYAISRYTNRYAGISLAHAF